MQFKVALVLAIVMASKRMSGCLKDDRFPYTIFLDSEQRIRFSWRVDYAKERVYFQTCVNALNITWFGVGFSDYGEITLADIVLYGKREQNAFYFQDMHTDSKSILRIDEHQDYHLLSAQAHRQQTILEFYRMFDTCDDNDYQFDRGTTHVIYFTSANSADNFDISRLIHGLQRVQLLKPEIQPSKFPPDMWTFDVTAPNIEIPAVQTTYWWYISKLPYMQHKHHIIKYEGIIVEGHEHLVHHMEVFHCEVPSNTIIRHYNGPGVAEGKPKELDACRKVIGAWAMGATPMVLPEEAGFPVGGHENSRYVLLEIHYNNPDKIAGVYDSSGVRFYVTSSLRKHDAGIMELGLEYTNKMAIPPRQQMFRLTGYCIEECTTIGLPTNGINIYASQLHTHLTGRRVYTKHLRRSTELPELNRDDHYSPHFQEIRRLPVAVRVLPGDALITTCEDTTMDRENATIGGFAISDEMCVNYIHYYPMTNLEVCKSSVSTEALKKFFHFMHRWDLDKTSPLKGDRENYQSIRWTPLTSYLLKTLYETSPISMQCNQSDGNRFPITVKYQPVLAHQPVHSNRHHNP